MIKVFLLTLPKYICAVLESQIEKSFIDKLSSELKYVYREDIHDRASLEENFR